MLNLFRKVNTEQVKKEYIKAVKGYKILCKDKRAAYFNEIKEKLRMVRDSKGFWEIIRFIKGNKFSQDANLDAEKWVAYLGNCTHLLGYATN